MYNIRTDNLVKRYGTRTVVNHVSFEVKQGEIVGLLGPNGAGKTTSFYQVVGLVKPDEGKVFLNNEDITKLPMYKRAKMGIGYLPQEASVFRKLSVEDNIAAVLEMTGLKKQEQKDKLEALLNEFRLQHVRKSNGDVLSGGERRRTEIARALAVDPKFILLDEPFAGIDPIAVEDIQAIVAKLKYKQIGILITDHNVTETLSICDRAYLLIEGKIFKHGTAEELAEDEQVRKLYLGRNFELKRKDWLHEEALKEAEGQEPGEWSPESGSGRQEAGAVQMDTASSNNGLLISFVEHMQFRTTELLKVLSNSALVGHGGMAVDLRADEYMQSLNELKSSLLSFAKENNHQELMVQAASIPDLNYKEYKRVFRAHDFASMATSMIVTATGRILLSQFYYKKLRRLRGHLQQTEGVLGTSVLYLKAQRD